MKIKKIMILFILILASITYASTVNVSADDISGKEKYYVLRNNVKIKKEDINIITNSATINIINEEWDNLLAEDIKINSETFDSNAEELFFDLKEEKGELKNNVETKIKIDEEIMTIKCDIMNFDNKNKSYQGESENIVKIIKNDYNIQAKKFSYKEEENVLYLEGDVYILNEKKKMELKSQQATFNTKTNEMKATKVNLTLEVEDKKED
ncbi:OstA-like protein [Oceanotoga teriensis]|uniref:OstA-like protein n=1 Tax=Oceanotoga teriensis TaxID=515440 RepID=A0AA45C8T4_9BACT|nr:LptA/OstA family protein [Oceanotoga teriensis]PWJ96277.1 OstA-like protein [Oceanotoga teriensis]